jgi:uncharacterized membrane protein YfcA
VDHGLLLLFLGFAVGMFGTLVGAGGGFLLMPALFFLYPSRPSEELTAISLAVVFWNAASGSVAYLRKGRVDFRSAKYFTLASLPGALVGAFVTQYFPRKLFDPLFAFFLILGGVYLFFRPTRAGRVRVAPTGKGRVRWQLSESDGTRHEISYSLAWGIWISVAVGFVSSLIGIGGGIIHVPALVQILGFPVHIATATSHFILAFTALAANGVHAIHGSLAPGLGQVLWLAPGAVLGAQVGARLSSRVRGVWIIRALALALGLVGLRLILL